MEIPVLVAGGGPVGLAVAFDLQKRGIRCMLVERNENTTSHPKMDVTNGRCMEHFRRLGLHEIVRDAAVPREHSWDVSWITDLGPKGHELARFVYPTVLEAKEQIRARNDGTQPLEPYMRMSQIVLEPTLKKELDASPLAEVRFGWEFVTCRQDENKVYSTIREVATGKTEEVVSDLLAGCDGGSSQVRESLGIQLSGRFAVAEVFMVHFHSHAHDVLQKFGIAWHYQTPRGATLIAQDDDQFWTLHTIFESKEQTDGIDPKKLVFEELGAEFELEVLQANRWTPHLCVADHYGRGRVWLAGDATHQYIPTGGYGMNTGIPDGMNLSWKFAAYLNGWGGQELLNSIESERRPIGLRNRQAAMTNMQIRLDIITANKDNCGACYGEGTAADAARKDMGKFILELGNIENEALGIEVDDRYVGSTVVMQEIVEPVWEMENYTPSTWPGMRAPHVYLADGSAIFDKFAFEGFTLVRFADVDVDPLLGAAKACGVPIEVLDIREDHVRAIYERDLVLVRCDQHVAWRGDTIDLNPKTIVNRIRGVYS